MRLRKERGLFGIFFFDLRRSAEAGISGGDSERFSGVLLDRVELLASAFSGVVPLLGGLSDES